MAARRTRWIAGALAAAIAIGWVAYSLYQRRRPPQWSGTIEARTIELASRVGGRVREVRVEEGDQVEAGRVLVVLEAEELQAEQLQAQAQLEQARATLEQLERGARPEVLAQARARVLGAMAALKESQRGPREEEINQARARRDAAAARLARARADHARARSLFEAGALARADLDAAAEALRTARSQHEEAAQALEALERGTRVEDIAQAQARALEARAQAEEVAAGPRVEELLAQRATVAAAEGRLAAIQARLGELVLCAPRPGVVNAIDLRPGDVLPPNAPAVSLLERDQLYARIYVPEQHLGRIRLGDEVLVTVDAFPRRSFPGRVEHISEVGEYTPRNLQAPEERANQVFATRVRILEGAEDLRAGMAAYVRVTQ